MGVRGARRPHRRSPTPGATSRLRRADYAARWIEGPEPIATSEPNGYGLYDMCENVHEWCSDWYDPRYYEVSPVEDPKGPESGTRKASRGGAWRHQIKIARCAARSSIPPEFRYADYGFRVSGRRLRNRSLLQRGRNLRPILLGLLQHQRLIQCQDFRIPHHRLAVHHHVADVGSF